MHHILRIMFVTWLTAGACLLADTTPQVYEGSAEFIAFGDFDGDGDVDTAIIDRATGQIRYAELKTSIVNWAFATVAQSGITDVSSVAVGHFVGLDSDCLVLTSPSANRLLVFTNSGRSLPMTVGDVGIGPALVFGVELVGDENTEYLDLAVYSQDNFLPNTKRWTLLLNNDGTAPAGLGEQDASTTSSGSPFSLPGESETMLAVVEGSDLVVLNPKSTGLAELNRVALGSAPSCFVHAPFSHGSDMEFLFASGSTVSCFRYYPDGALKTVGSVQSVDLGETISQMMVFEQKRLSWEAAEKVDRFQIGVVFADGTGAVYEFDGDSTPQLLQSVAAQGGRDVTGFVGIDYDWGRLNVLEGTDGTTTHASAYSYYWSDGTYHSRYETTALTELAEGTVTNVLLFQEEPFVSPTPGLVARYQKGTWTSRTFGLDRTPPTLNVRSEFFADEETGLAYPGTYNLGAAPDGAAFAFTNQFRDDSSMFCFDAPYGTLPLDVEAIPVSGTYDTAFEVAFQSPDETANIYYRRDAGEAWTLYAAPADGDLSLVVAHDQTFQYFAQSPSGARSPIRQAVYLFSASRFELDSDGDGVPDFVELDKGLDPLESGPDGDNDGVLDLEEVLGEPLRSLTQFTVEARPLVHDGTEDNNYIDVGKGTWVYAHNSLGSRLAESYTVDVAARATAYVGLATLEGIDASTGGLILLTTQPEFSVYPKGYAQDIGREILGFVQRPDLSRPALAYAYSGGTVKEEVAAWIAEAGSKWGAASSATPLVEVEFSPLNTLAILLLERAIDDILHGNGFVADGMTLSLTPFRQDEVDNSYLLDGALLRQFRDGGEKTPGQNLTALLHAITNALETANDPEVAELVVLTNTIYRLHIAAPAGELRRPITALRHFIANGEMDAAYKKALGGRADQSDAAAGVAMLIATRESRDTIIRNVIVQSDSFDAPGTVIVLDADDKTTEIQLVDALGGPGIGSSAYGLAPGIEIEVTGYLLEQAEKFEVVEVVSAEVTGTPSTDDGDDEDGDGMDDDWELLFFGSTDAKPDDDADEDGGSNLAEFLGGTDPRDDQDTPPTPEPTGLSVDGVYRTNHQYVQFTFTLPSGSGDLGYDLQIAEESDFNVLMASTAVAVGAPGEKHYTIGNFIPNDEVHHWRVRSRNAAGETSDWVVAATPLATTFVFDVHRGWNLLAAPVDTDQTVAEILPSATSLWRWDPLQETYVEVLPDEVLEAGVAYWFWYGEDGASEPFTGSLPDQLPPPSEGWNMLGRCPVLDREFGDQAAPITWFWNSARNRYAGIELATLLASPKVWFSGFWSYRYPAE